MATPRRERSRSPTPASASADRARSPIASQPLGATISSPLRTHSPAPTSTAHSDHTASHSPLLPPTKLVKHSSGSGHNHSHGNNNTHTHHHDSPKQSYRTSLNLQNTLDHTPVNHSAHNHTSTIIPPQLSAQQLQDANDYSIAHTRAQLEKSSHESTNGDTSHSAHTTIATGPRPAIRIGTRDSNLAMWQARDVRTRLAKIYGYPITPAQADSNDKVHHTQPNTNIPHTIEIAGMKTLGDIEQGLSLSSFSSKGVFTKELDIALLSGTIDCAVHCVKDLPTVLPPGLIMACIMERGDVADAVVLPLKAGEEPSAVKPTDLPSALPMADSIIGTSALRRIATIARYHPSYRTKDVRGNINTRLAKLDRGDYDALILAATGLKRIGLQHRISFTLSAHEYGHAVGQGALGILVRSDDEWMIEQVAALNHPQTAVTCTAERSFLRELEGGCKVPITVHTHFNASTTNTAADSTHSASCVAEHEPSTTTVLHIRGSVLSVDGKQEVKGSLECPVDFADYNSAIAAAHKTGINLGVLLRERGATPILNAIHANAHNIADVQQKPTRSNSNNMSALHHSPNSILPSHAPAAHIPPTNIS